jgi:DNA-binding NtrC family response regulator
MMTMGDMIDVQDFPAYLMQRESAHSSPAIPAGDPANLGTIEEHERILVIQALESAHGNQSAAARQLRIGRDALRYKMKKYGLEVPS